MALSSSFIADQKVLSRSMAGTRAAAAVSSVARAEVPQKAALYDLSQAKGCLSPTARAAILSLLLNGCLTVTITELQEYFPPDSSSTWRLSDWPTTCKHDIMLSVRECLDDILFSCNQS